MREKLSVLFLIENYLVNGLKILFIFPGILLFIVSSATSDEKQSYVADINFYFVTPKQQTVSSANHFIDLKGLESFPKEIGAWHGEDKEMAAWPHAMPDKWIYREYIKDENRILFQLTRTTDPVFLHVPKTCYFIEQYRIDKLGVHDIPLKTGKISVGTLQFSRAGIGGIEYYIYLWKDTKRDFAGGCSMIRATMNISENAEKTMAAIDDFILHLFDL